MTYNLLFTEGLDWVRLAAALADLATVPVDQVDVAPHGVEERNWKAAAL